MAAQPEEEIKLILLGESGVGKTSIIKRFLCEDFDENETTSCTMNFVAKILDFDKKKIKLNIWDTIGQEKYRSLSKLFLSDTKIVVLVYSIDVKESFDGLDYWYNLYTENLGNDLILGLAANKSDLYIHEQVTEEEGRKYAKEHNAYFGLLSAKDNKEGIDIFIRDLVKQYLIKNDKSNKNDKKENIKINSKQYENKNVNDGCCSGKKKVRQQRYNSIVGKGDGNLKAIILGADGCGKTSLLKRIKKMDFDENEKHTIDMSKSKIKYKSKNMEFNIVIVDINNEKKKTDAVIDAISYSKIFYLVFDINDSETYNQINYWVEVIKRCKEKIKDTQKFLMVIIGNKTDLQKNNENTTIIEEAKNFANEIEGIFLMTSALSNEGVENVILESVEKYLNSQ